MSAIKNTQPDPKTTATPTVGKFFAPTIQPKLTINQPGDAHEREADRVADQVVHRLSTSPPEKASTQFSSPTIQTKCADCEQEEKLQKKEVEEKPLQQKILRKPIFDSNTDDEGSGDDAKSIKRKESTSGGAGVTPDFSSRLSASKGGGTPLPEKVNNEMGSAMGTDFSNVRIHTGGAAAQMSQDIQAQAFTHGSDVYFNEGTYDSGSIKGKHLLAHELTHTIQQGGNSSQLPDISKAGVPNIQRGEAGVHHGIEKEATGNDPNKKESANATEEMYAGNFMRDYSQVNVPLVHNMLSKIPARIDGSSKDTIGAEGAGDISTALVRALAMLEFGPEITNTLITAENLGAYEPEHHIDNPQGTSAEDHLVTDQFGPRPAEELASGGNSAEGGWHSIHPEINEQLAGSAIPGLQMENTKLYEASNAGMTNHIFNSVEWSKEQMTQALQNGATPVGRMHLGAGLHVVEDYYSHSNFIEICLNSEIQHALKKEKAGGVPTLPKTFLRIVEKEPRVQGNNFVDSMYDAKTKDGRSMVTTGTFGSLDTRVSLSHIILPKLPKIVDIINQKTDELFGFTMSQKSNTWEKIKAEFKKERNGLAFIELAEAFDKHVQAPVYDFSLVYDEVPGLGFPYPKDFNFTTEYKGVLQAYNHYVAIYEKVKKVIDEIANIKDTIDQMLVFPAIVKALNELIKRLQEFIQQKIEEYKQQIKVKLTQVALGLIEAITGVDIPEEKKKLIGDAADWAEHYVEGMEHSTSLESRMKSGEIEEFKSGRLKRGDTDEQIAAEIKNVYGVDEKGNPIQPLPPSHSEISKDHPPHTEIVKSHDVRITLVPKKYSATFNDRPYSVEILQPLIVPDEEHEAADGSIFYELHRQFALEADRQIISQVSQIWATNSGAQMSTPDDLYSTPKLNVNDISKQARQQQTKEGQRAGQEGRKFKTGEDLNIPGASDVLALVDLFVSHPDDNTWWQPILQNYVAAHEEQVIAHIKARNKTRTNRPKK